MNQQILNYLNQNKDKFTREQLNNALLSVGHKKEEIDEAIVYIYQPIVSNQNFSQSPQMQNTFNQPQINTSLNNIQSPQPQPKKKLTRQQKVNFVIKFFGGVGILLIVISIGIIAYRFFNKKEVSGDVLSGMVENTKVSDYMTEVEKGMVKKGEYKIGKSSKLNDYNGVYTLALDSVEATSLDLKFNITLSFAPKSTYSYGYISLYDAKLTDNNGKGIPTSRVDGYYSYSSGLAESFYKDPSPKKGYIAFSQTTTQADSFTLKIDKFAPIEGIILK